MNRRESWIDCIKVLACALILVGHLLQGLLRTGILVRDSRLDFFIWLIYLFHVQLFFLSSGYLYERGQRAENFKEWIRNIGYKFISLGVPYFVFSIITWLLKNEFVDLVNIRTGHLFDFLFLSPTSAQYWYLYTLFFLFVFIPNVKNIKILMGILIVLFVLYMFSAMLAPFFVIYSIAQYGFWFVLGMIMQRMGFENLAPKKRILFTSLVFLILFVGISSALYSYGYRATFSAWTILLGTLACLGFSILFKYLEAGGVVIKSVTVLSMYTFPIYLLHTIYAASIRTFLIFIGIRNIPVHVVLGIVFGFYGSILTAFLFHKLVYPEFVFYPWKVIKKIKNKT